MHRLDGGQILVNYAFKAPASVAHIADNSAEYTHIGVGIDINLDIHQLAQLYALEN